MRECTHRFTGYYIKQDTIYATTNQAPPAAPTIKAIHIFQSAKGICKRSALDAILAAATVFVPTILSHWL